MKVILPNLVYPVWKAGEDLSYVDPLSGLNLISVHSVVFWRATVDSRLLATIQGRLRTKSGARSRHSREIQIDPEDASLPGWLKDLVTDAKRRLP